MSSVSRPLDSAGTALCGRTALGSASRPRSPKALPGGMFRMRLKGVWFRVGTETSAHRGNQFHRSDLGNAARGLHPASALHVAYLAPPTKRGLFSEVPESGMEQTATHRGGKLSWLDSLFVPSTRTPPG